MVSSHNLRRNEVNKGFDVGTAFFEGKVIFNFFICLWEFLRPSDKCIWSKQLPENKVSHTAFRSYYLINLRH